VGALAKTQFHQKRHNAQSQSDAGSRGRSDAERSDTVADNTAERSSYARLRDENLGAAPKPFRVGLRYHAESADSRSTMEKRGLASDT
jgi:hypothetical protein